ncbi:MAG: NB-ARC domain-containing protein [Synechococcales bacterium]|nr:NB-ARC domain-containing protein [Synechococcales bacterium]
MNQHEFIERFQSLTPKPRRVLELMLAGRSDEEIADMAEMSMATVRKHVQNLCDHFGILREVEGIKRNRRDDLIDLTRMHQRLAQERRGKLAPPPPPKPALEIGAIALPRKEDWGDAMDISTFLGRQAELQRLKEWVLRDRCRLVAVLGLGGIGKTALTVKLAQDIRQDFDVVVWRSLRDGPLLSSVLTEVVRMFFGSSHRQCEISDLMVALQRFRCLLVLDNAETIFQSGQGTLRDRAGQYRPEYEDYGQLFQQMAEVPHRSCLVVTSREKPKEIAVFEGQQLPVRSLTLNGLTEQTGQELLKLKGFTATGTHWNAIIRRYGGNPLALKIVATMINELFNGNVNDYLGQVDQGDLIFGEIRDLLDQQFNRLSNLEKEVMYWFAINREPMSLQDFREDVLVPISAADLMEILESLSRRSLIERNAAGFTQQPVIMEYVTEQLTEQVCQEIETETIALLDSHALLKTRSKDYIRETQRRAIVQRVINRLLVSLRSKEAIEHQLRKILLKLKTPTASKTGYAGGNLLNLLVQLNPGLSGYDFSGLSIRHAYLKGKRLHNVNFTHANLATSVFTETFVAILCIAFSPDGQLLATGDASGEARLWRVADGEHLRTYKGHKGWIWALAFSPDGRTIASGGDDHTVHLWRVADARCFKVLDKHSNRVRTLTFSPDGQLLASGSSDDTVRLWDAQTGQCLQTFKGHEASIRSIAFSPNGQLLASGSADHTVRLWKVGLGTCAGVLQGHTAGVRSVKFSPDGQMVVSGGSDRTIRFWNPQDGALLYVLTGHESRIWSVAFHPSGTLLASGSDDQTVRLWDMASRRCVSVLRGHTSRVWSVAFSPDQLTLASSGDDHTVRLWNVNTRECLQTLQGHTLGVRAIAFSPNGIHLASGSDEWAIRIWNVETGKQIQTLQGHLSRVWSVAFSPTESMLASGSDDQTVRLWDLKLGECRRIFKGHDGWVRAVAFSADGRTIASGGDDETIKLWDVTTGDCLDTLTDHEGWIWTLAFAPQQPLLASGSTDQTIRLWDLESRQYRILKGHENWVRSIAFSPDGSILASGGGDHTIRLWDVKSGRCLSVFEGLPRRVRSLAFSADGQTLACSGEETSIQLWDVTTGDRIQMLEGHGDWVRSVAFSPTGTLLASASKDETIRLWDIKTGQTTTFLRPKRPYEGMNITEVKGLTGFQRTALLALGAVDQNFS